MAATYGYHSLQQTLAGLDYLAFAAVSFVAAILISLMKVGPLRHGLDRWKKKHWPGPTPVPTAEVTEKD